MKHLNTSMVYNIMSVYTKEEMVGHHAKNEYKTNYPRCTSYVVFMEYTGVYQCILKEGHKGDHKCIQRNSMGTFVGYWNNEIITKNLFL